MGALVVGRLRAVSSNARPVDENDTLLLTSFVQTMASSFSKEMTFPARWTNTFFASDAAAAAARDADPQHVMMAIDFATPFDYTIRVNSTYLPVQFKSASFMSGSLSSSMYANVFVGVQV